MGSVLSYSLYSSILLSLLYLTYKWILSGENQHRYNRVALWVIYAVALTALPVADHIGGLMAASPAPVPVAEIDFEEVVVSVIDDGAFAGPSQPVWPCVLLWVYLAGVVVALSQTVWVGLRLRRIISCGEVAGTYDGRIVVVTDEEGIAPFSWCRYVVMSRKDWDEDGRMILVHELQHLRLRHWIDLLVAQAVGVFQWYNPAAWLMREELKAVHEYQADGAVLRSGVGAREYQMLLIRKAVGERFTSLANSLNHSKLKKRITMMYNTGDAPSRRLRGLALVPALAVALCLADLDVVASVIDDVALATIVSGDEDEAAEVDEPVFSEENYSEAGRQVPENHADIAADSGAAPADDETARPDGKTDEGVARADATAEAPDNSSRRIGDGAEDTDGVTVIAYADSAPVASSSAAQSPVTASTVASSPAVEIAEASGRAGHTGVQPEDAQVFNVVEHKPMFPGGDKELLRYVAENIRYPREAMAAGVEGRVVVQFVVKKDGAVGDVRVVHSRGEELDREAMRVIKTLPGFIPGTIDGKPVNVWYTLPVTFRIKDDKSVSASRPLKPINLLKSVDEVMLHHGDRQIVLPVERIAEIVPTGIDSINVRKDGITPEVHIYLKDAKDFFVSL